ncbi:MAG: hypothetical protein WAX80_01175 [Minisyncoccia bacterium]
MQDDETRDDETEVNPPIDDEIVDGKKKLLDDEDVESLDDAVDDELAVDKEDLMDDVEEM